MPASGWDEVADGVFRRCYPSFLLNVGLVVGDGEALLVDTRCTAREGQELAADVEALGGVPVRHVVNTHAHFDHCFGNAAFAGARRWGHRGCAADLEAAGERQRRAMLDALRAGATGSGTPVVSLPDLAATPIVPPDALVDGEVAVEVGGREVRLLHLGRGHTDHDLVVVVGGAGVVFAGDLVEESGPPVFEEAWPLEWPATLARLDGLGARVVVPGHGEPVGAEFVRGQQAELAALADLATRVRGGHLDLAGALAASPYPQEPTRVALGRLA